MNRLTLLLICGFLVFASGAEAQQALGECTQTSRSSNRIGENHIRLAGRVEIECPDLKFYADEVDLFTDTNRLVATGNVVFVSTTNQIGAERVEFDTKTRTGVFVNASGTASLGEQGDRSMFGTQEPDVYFYGETIEKLGARTYRVTRGGFTTCVQPTPRWEFAMTSVTLTLDKHAVLWNAVLKVKDVPLFYLPVLYYPLEGDDRSTGLLIPTYGGSTYRGHSLSNAFFWAIDRSQDATFFHDWYSKTGQGFGGEYRYAAAPGSEGSARVYLLREHEAVVERPGARPTILPARRSYLIRAGGAQGLPAGLRAQGSVDYFSDVTVLPAYSTNIYNASQRTRTYTGIVGGTWGVYSLSGLYSVSQIFYGSDSSTKYGGAPRISFSQSQRRIGSAPLYFAVASQFARQVYESHVGTRVSDRNLSRLEASPVLRVPLNKLSFLTWDSTVAWSNTYYTESLDSRGAQVPEPLWRSYFDLRSEVVGPVFVRIWNTPDNGYAEKFKHIIEPSVEVRYVTAIDNADQVVKVGDASDYVIGRTAQVRYRLTNRLLARRRQGQSAAASSEILAVSLQQTYYTDKAASQVDPSYSTSFRGRKPSDISPLSVGVTGSPTDSLSMSARLEYDFDLPGMQSLGISGSGGADVVRINGGYSRRRIPGRLDMDSFLNVGATVRAPGNRFGGSYAFNYDYGRDTMLQQRILGYYNAQCCGLVVDFQTYNFPVFDPRYAIPKDRRFNISFTLAGIGTFSNFFGALGGGTDRR